jgi:hypothetical protein
VLRVEGPALAAASPTLAGGEDGQRPSRGRDGCRLRGHGALTRQGGQTGSRMTRFGGASTGLVFSCGSACVAALFGCKDPSCCFAKAPSPTPRLSGSACHRQMKIALLLLRPPSGRAACSRKPTPNSLDKSVLRMEESFETNRDHGRGCHALDSSSATVITHLTEGMSHRLPGPHDHCHHQQPQPASLSPLSPLRRTPLASSLERV